MADIFDVIADATRRELLQHLLEASPSGADGIGELSVSELVDRMDATQPTVSKHLKVLRDHGLVTVREDGQHRYYRVEASPLEEVEDFVLPFLNDDLGSIGSTAFAAWAGADVSSAGSTVGRVAAGASHQARTVIHEAQEKLHDVQEAVVKRLPWKRDDEN